MVVYSILVMALKRVVVKRHLHLLTETYGLLADTIIWRAKSWGGWILFSLDFTAKKEDFMDPSRVFN